ncbi:MAG: M24 family metallopeptidase [Caldilineaceae bacterium]|nr:M24 family metallopeptidase [Caldilineaceae bacterium]MDE0337593.1 M24 family metallopeptidase [Caldilineaceae bacterium]
MKLQTIHDHLHQHNIAGWLLYDFRGQNPIAASVAGLESTGTRRWFLWIPAGGKPQWLVHAIEQSTFSAVSPEMAGPLHLYVGWQELEQKLQNMLPQDADSRIAMEYSPNGAIPYVSNVDAGTLEMVRATTNANVVSSADLVQLVQAVLTSQQMDSHRRAAAHVLAAKDAAFAFVAQALRQQQEITEYAVQQFIVEQFRAAELTWDHDPIVAVNGNAALPHYAPSAQQHSPIRPGDVLLIDLWAKESNGPADCYADVTWTAFCGEEPPPAASRVFSVVARARDTAVTAINGAFESGHTIHGYEVDDAVSTVITDAGFGEGILHRTGHSLGPNIHWNGVNIDNVETQDRRTLIPGVMFTIEPGIYLPQLDFDQSGQPKGLGIRSEVNCIVHDGRLEVTTLPYQTELIALGS